MLEASLTFPIIIYLMFFVIEILRFSSMQIALDSIVTEMAFDFMGSKETNNFDNIILKYRPKYMTNDKISWYFSIYQDLESMNADNIKMEDTPPSFDKKYGADLSVDDPMRPEKSFSTERQADLFKTLSQKAFTLTVVCDYKFASEFIEKCFFAFAKKDESGRFVIFSKCVGICR